MQKVIVVVGPTSSGKSALGVFLAQKLNGEVISADSRQVYKGLDIGTGKITKKEMSGIPHHLLDAASPKKQFTADDFVRRAQQAMSLIRADKRIAVVVGGTGFYIDTLLGRMKIAHVPPNPALRIRLEKKPVGQLFAMLKKLDPARVKTIAPKHKRRIIRAIEIAKFAKVGNPKGERRTLAVEAEGEPAGLPTGSYEVLWLGLNPDEKKLKANIHKRLLTRMKAGMVAEAKKLHKAGLSYKRMGALGLEYRYLALYLQKKITREEMLERLERAIVQYAKRQKRWFKRNQEINWLRNKNEGLKLAQEFAGGR